jgi:putative hydrolase of the HAD superfamily
VPEWRAVVFDLDDTLFPEREYVMSGFRAVARWAEAHLGIDSASGFDELQAMYDRGIRGDTFDQWLRSRHVDPTKWVPQFVEVYRQHQPIIEPFPEVPGLLRQLKPRYRLGLLTDGYLDVQRRKLAALKLEEWFDAIVFTDEWGRTGWKPNTVAFEALLGRLGNLSAAEVVYVGDNPTKDFLAARRSGLYSVEVRRPQGVYAHVQPPSSDHRANLVIRSLGALPAALLQGRHVPGP